MRILAGIILALTLFALAACTSEERDVLDTSDPATWARMWLIERAVEAKNASEYSQWLAATSGWEILLSPCDPDSYLGLPAERDHEAFQKACTELASVFDGHDTGSGVGGRFERMTEAEQSNVEGILDQLYCDMGYQGC